jgi:protease I
MSSTLLIIAPEGFQDIELAGTQKELTKAKYQVTIASTEAGECTGKFGGKVTASIALRDVNVADFDRIGFIGGPGAEMLKDDPEAQRIARETVASKKPLGAICIAPLILAEAGVLEGKKATVWDFAGEQAQILREHGAVYTGESVTKDGLIVTGNGPQASEEFGRVLAQM